MFSTMLQELQNYFVKSNNAQKRVRYVIDGLCDQENYHQSDKFSQKLDEMFEQHPDEQSFTDAYKKSMHPHPDFSSEQEIKETVSKKDISAHDKYGIIDARLSGFRTMMSSLFVSDLRFCLANKQNLKHNSQPVYSYEPGGYAYDPMSCATFRYIARDRGCMCGRPGSGEIGAFHHPTECYP